MAAVSKNTTRTAIEDDDEVRRLYLEHWLGERNYDIYQLISDVTYARRSVLREWLRDKGYDPDEILVFEDEKVSVSERNKRDELAVNVCLRLWLEDMERYGRSDRGRV